MVHTHTHTTRYRGARLYCGVLLANFCSSCHRGRLWLKQSTEWDSWSTQALDISLTDGPIIKVAFIVPALFIMCLAEEEEEEEGGVPFAWRLNLTLLKWFAIRLLFYFPSTEIVQDRTSLCSYKRVRLNQRFLLDSAFKKKLCRGLTSLQRSKWRSLNAALVVPQTSSDYSSMTDLLTHRLPVYTHENCGVYIWLWGERSVQK